MKKLIGLALVMITASCQGSSTTPKSIADAVADSNIKSKTTDNKGDSKMDKNTETAIFAGGCFWCTEAFFTDLKGVEKVVSGYIGGKTVNPTYKEICSGMTGHAEAIQITFNPEEVSYDDLLEIFFETHDPTTINRQGADVGTQYRSEIFYTTTEQKAKAENFIKLLTDQDIFGKKIVTKITEAPKFYPAEEYHQDYYAQNANQPYCQMVIAPKMEKLQKNYKSKLKQ
ncbi:MAG: peptide-methionine (S)-S-oxide reductase [Pedobacter sp.]|nr:MAG: peptide-methionine (S)-S-oxide reductase [Pedobacter sp.]